jgi:hypothetical protein
MNININIGLINWYINRHWFGNIIRNLLLPIWLDWKTKSIDFNCIPIGVLIVLIYIL